MFRKRIKIFIKRGYDPIILQLTACLVVSPYTYGYHAYLFGCAMTGPKAISNGIISSKVYDKRDDFDFVMVDYLHMDEDVSHCTPYAVYISQLIRFLFTLFFIEW